MSSLYAYILVFYCFICLHVAATGWIQSDTFSSVSNSNNECNTAQRSGFNWNGLQTGSFGSFGDFGFSGFECKSSFGKRSLVRRTFQDKCIEGSVSTNPTNNPKIASGSDKPFSVTHMEVSVTFDTALEFHYGMPDGSVCKTISPCSSRGTTVTNTQCGGAKSVTLKLPDNSNNKTCQVGIHSIGFDCSPPASTVSPKNSATSVASKTSSVVVPSIGTPNNISSSPPPVISGPASSQTINSSPALSGVPMTTSTVFATSVFTVKSCASSVKDCPVRSGKVITSIIAISTTICPVSAASTTFVPSSAAPSSRADLPASITEIAASSKPASSSVQLSSSQQASFPVRNSSSTTVTAVQMTTSTIFSTLTSTIISCAATVASCPASSTQIVTSVIAVSTTICPVTSQAGSAPPLSSAVSTTATGDVTRASTISQTSSTITTQFAGSSAVSSATSSATISSPVISSLLLAPTGSKSAPAPIQESITTIIVLTSVTTCPVTNTVVSGAQTSIATTQRVSTVLITTISTICQKCAENTIPSSPIAGSSSFSLAVPNTVVPSNAATSTAGTSPPKSTLNAPIVISSSTQPSPSSTVSPSTIPSAPAISANVPDVLPKCLNTWLFQTGCASNSDHNCYCSQSNFTTNVINCVQSWSNNNNEIQSALSYMAGICAAHVNQNPAIITAIPTTITLAPSPISTAGAPNVVSSPAPSSAVQGPVSTPGASVSPIPSSLPQPPAAIAPVTIISVIQTVTVPCTYTSGSSAGSLIPSSSTTALVSAVMTVPQVQFITQSASSGAQPIIGLAAGAPSSVPAGATQSSVGNAGGLTTFKSSFSAAGGTGVAGPSSSGVALFTGGAGKESWSGMAVGFCAVMALWGLL